jgi:hypothetical protein
VGTEVFLDELQNPEPDVNVMSRLRMCGAMPPFAESIFKTWCIKCEEMERAGL